MTSTVWEYILIFFIYALLGWMTEVIFAALRSHTLVNRGFLNGPVCPVYGFGMVAMLVLLGPHAQNILAVFLAGVIVPSLVELIAGALMYGLFHARWWDYSDKPFNLYGQICPLYTIYWYFLCYPAFWLLRLLRGGGNPGHRQFTQKSAYKRDCKRAANRV